LDEWFDGVFGLGERGGKGREEDGMRVKRGWMDGWFK
jgi:hypothetical protein